MDVDSDQRWQYTVMVNEEKQISADTPWRLNGTQEMDCGQTTHATQTVRTIRRNKWSVVGSVNYNNKEVIY